MKGKLTPAVVEAWASLVRTERTLLDKVEEDLKRARLPPVGEAEQARLHRRVEEDVSLETHARRVATLYQQLLAVKSNVALG